MIERITESLATALRAVADRLDPESYPIGKPSVDAEGKHLPRCTSCGIPRGTLRHGLRCSAGLCGDPDAKAKRVVMAMRGFCDYCGHPTRHHGAYKCFELPADGCDCTLPFGVPDERGA